MKFPFPAVFIVLLAFAFAACKRAPIKAPDPNPVGQWDWSNDLLGSWRLEIKADGTFQRETTSPFDPRHVRVSGRWALVVAPSEMSWAEHQSLVPKAGRDEEWARLAGVDPTKNTVQWSAPSIIKFLYNSPRGSELAPGAVWTGAMSTPANSPAEMGIEEKHLIHTHTDTSGEVFLDLAGKVFRKSDTAETAKVPSGETARTAGEIPEPTVKPAEKTEFLTVEPFSGITLDLPANWQGVDPNDAKKQTTSVAALMGKPRPPKTNSSLHFTPPGEAQDVHVFVSVQPTMFSPKQLADSSSIDLDRFASGFIKGAAHPLEEKGYHLEPNVTADFAQVGKISTIVCVGKMVDPVGNRRTVRAFAIPTEFATVIIECCWDAEPGTPWKEAIERACSSVRIADTFKALAPPKEIVK
ncbi:MAG: hypothetical protein P4L99_12510 [Chthoniobacter sp.]|nr:hypothetical protein [Chthoniobacter sp.]